MAAKRLSDLTPSDIRLIVGSRIQEDRETEFKKTLPTRDGQEDRWIVKGDDIGSAAKKDIAKELIAFANAIGGTLYLGIVEDGEGRAASLNLIPRCRDLADRLAASIAVSSDPRLDSLEAVGVEIEGESGVVVFRVSASARAPHRDKDSREAYWRNGQRSEPMDMYQIQSLAVDRWKGIQSINDRLKSRTLDFNREYHREFTVNRARGVGKDVQLVHLWVSGCRATAIPLDRVLERHIATRKDLRLCRAPLRLHGRAGGSSWGELEALSWKPILRGIRYREDFGHWAQTEERLILADGLIELTSTSSEYFNPEDGDSSRHLPASELLRKFAQFIVMVEAFRRLIGRPTLGFALALEWRIPGNVKAVLPDEQRFWSQPPMSPSQEVNLLDDIEFPDALAIKQFWSDLQAEFFHSLGREHRDVFPVEFEPAVQAVVDRARVQ